MFNFLVHILTILQTVFSLLS